LKAAEDMCLSQSSISGNNGCYGNNSNFLSISNYPGNCLLAIGLSFSQESYSFYSNAMLNN